MNKKRIAILISGRGSNMAALIGASVAPNYPAQIVGVLSNIAGAAGLDLATAAGIATATIPHRNYSSKPAHEGAINAQLDAWRVDLVCLAGYMRLLTPGFAERWAGRLINIHPSLLPKYKGLDTHARAIAAGDTEHGCTVHFVTAEMDGGPIIAQARVPVLAGDTAEALARRVLAEEHKLYPKALAMVASGEARMTPR